MGLVLLMLGTRAAAAAELASALAAIPLEKIFPGAGGAGPVEGDPPSAPVFRNGKVAGYVFLTSDVVGSVGFAGKPVKILVGFDLDARITGAAVVEHQEPILVLGIPEVRLYDFVAQYTGVDVRRRVHLGAARSPQEVGVDMISGASITSLVFSDSILRGARLVGRARGVLGGAGSGGRRVDVETFHEADWPALLRNGSLARLRLTNAEAARAFAAQGRGAAIGGGAAPDPEGLFIDLYAGLATPAAIGQNLLGFTAYNALMAGLPTGAQAIFVAGRGYYSFRGYSYRRTGVFERLQLVQGDKTLRLTRDMHRRVDRLHIAGAPELREMSLFSIPAAAGFDATRPWRLEVLAERPAAGGGSDYAGFPLTYRIPAALVRGGGPATAAASIVDEDLRRPLWQIRWGERIPHIVFLSLVLAAILVILFFQDWVTRRRGLLDWLRLGFLSVTLVYVGWIANVQLSVINVLTFVNSLRTGFRWDFFLLEPLIFILWSFVAVALLFWGRGVFCGWLCPFGALQELLNRAAVKLNVPQIAIPFALNERIWPLKYVVFLSLFALSLGTTGLVVTFAEIEPFKTSITLKFLRAWPFVTYAVLVLAASLFVKRLFCRYLCPLGAALAIPGKNHMFDWLKRRPQCGTECHICASQCPVQAIHPNGRINAHECIYCLECQQLYYDDHKCPPMLARRKRLAERARLRREAAAKAETKP